MGLNFVLNYDVPLRTAPFKLFYLMGFYETLDLSILEDHNKVVRLESL